MTSILNLFRVIIPSWRFFDELGDISRLQYRFGNDSKLLGPWILYSKKPRRNLLTLFFNPQENLYLAQTRLLSELPSSLPLVENLVLWEIGKTEHGKKIFFRFKVGETESETREHLFK